MSNAALKISSLESQSLHTGFTGISLRILSQLSGYRSTAMGHSTAAVVVALTCWKDTPAARGSHQCKRARLSKLPDDTSGVGAVQLQPKEEDVGCSLSLHNLTPPPPPHTMTRVVSEGVHPLAGGGQLALGHISKSCSCAHLMSAADISL